MRIRVLGPVLVGDPPDTLSRRDRVVLSALAVRRGRPVEPSDLADALWAGAPPPATWTKVIQGSVVRLRHLLGRDAITWNPDGYVLRVAADDLDVAVFEQRLARGRNLSAIGETARASGVLQEALALWRGPALPDVDGWPPAHEEVLRLQELRAEAEEEQLSAAVGSGRADESAVEAQRLVTEAPYRERRWALLALALYADGRQADALAAIGRARSVLRDELGLDPGPALVALERSILDQDPVLPRARGPRSSGVCPYQGLRPFQTDDADLFVGREGDVVACVRRLDEHPLLLVVGPSGSGKSSFVRAGLVPALTRRGPVTVLVPGPDPLTDLVSARCLRESGAALVVDQLEELVDADGFSSRSRFLDEVADWAETGPVVLTVRSDRLELVTRSPRLAALANRGIYLLPSLEGSSLRRAIVEPADRVGLLIEPGLVDLLLRDVGERPGALPLLSHAIRETWGHREGDVLTVEGYLATGGVAGAVAQTADSLYAELSSDEREALRALLLRLVALTPDGVPVGTRVRTTPRTDPVVRSVIERLASNRLLTVDEGTVALSHESLVMAWPRLRLWWDDDVRGRRMLEHLQVAATGWAAGGRPDSELYRGSRLAAVLEWREASRPLFSDEETEFLCASAAKDTDDRRVEQRALVRQRRQNRRLRISLGGVVALTVVALLAGAMAMREGSRATRAARDVDAARLGDLAVREPRADTALLVARQAVELAATPQTSADLLRAVDGRSDIRTVRATGLTGWIGAQVHVSPDGGRLLAVAPDGVALVDSVTGGRIPAGRPLDSGGVEAALYAVGFVDGGRTAVTAGAAPGGSTGSGCELRRFEAGDGAGVGGPEPVPGSRCGDFWTMDRLRVSVDGRVLVSMSGGEVRVWHRAGRVWEGPRTITVPGLERGVPVPRDITLSTDGRRAAVVVEVSGVPPWYRLLERALVVDLAEGRVLVPPTSDPALARAALSPGGDLLAVGRFDGGVTVEPVTGTPGRSATVVSTGGSDVTALRWAADGVLVVGRHDGTVDVVDTTPSPRVTSLSGHGSEVVAVAGAGSARSSLVSLDAQGTVLVRTPGAGTVLGPRRVVPRPHAVAVLPDGPVLVGEEGGVVAAYARGDLVRVRSLRLDPGAVGVPAAVASERRRVTALAASADGVAVVAGDRSGRLTRWSWPEGRTMWSHDDAPTAFLGLSPDGATLVTAEFTPDPDDPEPDGPPRSSRVRLWDARTGRELASLDTGAKKPRFVTVSPDSALAVVGFFDEGVEVVDLHRHLVAATLEGTATAGAFSPRGDRLLLVDAAGGARAFDPLDWSVASAFATDGAGYAHVAFEGTGRLLFLASERAVSVWDAGTFHRFFAGLSLTGDGTNDAMFLAEDGASGDLVVAGQHEVEVLDLDERTWRDSACRIAGRALTRDEWRRLLPDRPYAPACR